MAFTCLGRAYCGDRTESETYSLRRNQPSEGLRKEPQTERRAGQGPWAGNHQVCLMNRKTASGAVAW